MGDPYTVSTHDTAPPIRPEQQSDHAEGTPLTMSRQAHLQRSYTALWRAEHTTARGDANEIEVAPNIWCFTLT